MPTKDCYTYETDKEELRGKKLTKSNSGTYLKPAAIGGKEYDFLIYGPQVCGKSYERYIIV